MIFLRTPGGISHDPAESVAVEDVAKALECGLHLLDQLAASSPHLTKGRTVHNLGQTRSSQQSNHLLITADTFVRNPLPGMKGASPSCMRAPPLAPGSLNTRPSLKPAANWAALRPNASFL